MQGSVSPGSHGGQWKGTDGNDVAGEDGIGESRNGEAGSGRLAESRVVEHWLGKSGQEWRCG